MLKLYRLFFLFYSILLLAIAAIAQTAIAETSARNPIGIEVTTHLGDKQTFKQGDMIAFLISLDKDAHVLMIYQDAQQKLIQIIPNRYRQQDLYQAGLFIAVPDRSEPFEFTVNPPFGQEKLWVFASNQAFPALEGTEMSNGLRQLNNSLSEILAIIRPTDPDIAYGESSTVIHTEPN